MFYDKVGATAARLVDKYGTRGVQVDFNGAQETAGANFSYVQGQIKADTIPNTITSRVDTVIYVPRRGNPTLEMDQYVRLSGGVLHQIVGVGRVKPADTDIMDIYYLKA